MPKNLITLRRRFSNFIVKNWIINNHNLGDISCVYAILSTSFDTKFFDIEYIGSTTKLNSRYRAHKIPHKIQEEKRMNILFYLPMRRGFYDYEIKLIKKLKPRFNRQHKGDL